MEHCQNYCFTSRLGCKITVSKNHSHPGCETVVLTAFRFVLTEHYTAADSRQQTADSRQQQAEGGMKAQSTAQRREQRAAHISQLGGDSYKTSDRGRREK
jgi:hypothetical protein